MIRSIKSLEDTEAALRELDTNQSWIKKQLNFIMTKLNPSVSSTESTEETVKSTISGVVILASLGTSQGSLTIKNGIIVAMVKPR